MAFDWALSLLGIGIVCGVLLIIMAFLGGFDMGADVDTDVGAAVGPNALGIPTVLAVLSLFGLIGYAVTAAYGDIMLGLGVGVAVSAIAGTIIYLGLRNLFLNQESSSDLRSQDFVGQIGEVSVSIARDGPGQVLVVHEARGRTLMTASANEDIRVGERVMIVGAAGGGVIVERLRKDEKKR